MPRHKQLDPNILEAALAGLEAQRQRIEQHIAEVSHQLGRGRAKVPTPTPEDGTVPKPRRKMSAAARKRIAAAQKRRWAEFRKKHAKKK